MEPVISSPLWRSMRPWESYFKKCLLIKLKKILCKLLPALINGLRRKFKPFVWFNNFLKLSFFDNLRVKTAKGVITIITVSWEGKGMKVGQNISHIIN